MPTLQQLTDRIRQAVTSGAPLDRSVKLDLRGEGVIHVAGVSVTNADLPADLVVSLTRADLAALGKGQLDSTRAIMTGRMRVSNMALAFSLRPRIQALFEMAT